MDKVLRSKAESSDEFRSELLATGDKVLIEARQDLWCGSGLSYRITTTTNPKHHPGHSWLGEILMKIRSDLISDNAMNKPELSEQDVCINACLPREPRAPIKRGRNTHQTKGRSASFSEIKIRSMSLSPSRIQSLKGAKFYTPLLKNFLRKQAKYTRTQSDDPEWINGLQIPGFVDCTLLQDFSSRLWHMLPCVIVYSVFKQQYITIIFIYY